MTGGVPMTAAPIISEHRGKTVVLSPWTPSPPVTGPKRMMAHALLETIPLLSRARDYIAAVEKQTGPNMGVMGNDRLGNCTCAAVGHAKQVMTANNGAIVTPSDAEVIAAYELACGYNPADPSTDQGGVETEVLGDWEQIGLCGFKIKEWIPVNPSNLGHVMKAIERFGFVYGGHGLPLIWQNEEIWQFDGAAGDRGMPGSWGGHAVVWPAYDADARFLECITWGMRQRATHDAFLTYTGEAYGVVCELWTPGGVSPIGDQASDLLNALRVVGS